MRKGYRGMSARNQLAVQREVRKQFRIMLFCFLGFSIATYIFLIKPIIGV